MRPYGLIARDGVRKHHERKQMPRLIAESEDGFVHERELAVDDDTPMAVPPYLAHPSSQLPTTVSAR